MDSRFSSEPATFWRSYYQQGITPWDLGTVAPPFVSLLKKTEVPPGSALPGFPTGKLVSVGCGYGHDAAFFGQHGFDVMGLDYAKEAIEGAIARYGQWAKFQEADIFNLPDDLIGSFDYVLEHTCFCAIPPNRRSNYVRSVLSLLKPGGTFIGLFWADVPDNGPPYPTSNAEIRALFTPRFQLDRLDTPQDSIDWRRGQERLGVFTLQPVQPPD